ncbi:unnamed protein product, partial [Allacma fusca]
MLLQKLIYETKNKLQRVVNLENSKRLATGVKCFSERHTRRKRKFEVKNQLSEVETVVSVIAPKI